MINGNNHDHIQSKQERKKVYDFIELILHRDLDERERLRISHLVKEAIQKQLKASKKELSLVTAKVNSLTRKLKKYEQN